MPCLAQKPPPNLNPFATLETGFPVCGSTPTIPSSAFGTTLDVYGKRISLVSLRLGLLVLTLAGLGVPV